MSVENFLVAGLSHEGSIKKALQAGLTPDDFELHDEEFLWMVERTERKEPITPIFFKKRFPEFEFVLCGESMTDLAEELKKERAYIAIQSAIDELLGGEFPLDQDNALDKTADLVEILDNIRRSTGTSNNVVVESGWEKHYERAKNLYMLRDNGEIPGIPTGLAHLDFHLGGLQPETTYLYLGRPGDAKSFSVANHAVEAAWNGYRAVIFSPEMTEHAHMARFHTLYSAKPEVQEALGLKEAFRNRALKDGRGYNLKNYKRFLQWIDSEVTGSIILITQKYRRERMTVGYIRAQAKDLGADLVIVDPVYKLKPLRFRGSRWEELAEITSSLMDIAHELNIPVVLSNQANRALIGTKDDAPGAGSSFGSDTPVQEADSVIGVKHYSDEHLLKMRCSKNRYGERFAFSAKFLPNFGIIEDITPMRDEWAQGYDAEALEKLAAELDEENDTYA
jgi:DnaB-like helicase C terminal domain